VAEFKAFVATIAEAAKQKKLSEEIQLDAVEMVRRSERALGIAVQQGQEAGEIMQRGETLSRGNRYVSRDQRDTAISKPSAESFFSGGHSERTDSYVMATATDEEYEAVIVSGKEEGNLSRANVTAKVKDISSYRDKHEEKWATIAEMADQGYRSAQIAKAVGMDGDRGTLEVRLRTHSGRPKPNLGQGLLAPARVGLPESAGRG
jgi:hypothetical protein